MSRSQSEQEQLEVLIDAYVGVSFPPGERCDHHGDCPGHKEFSREEFSTVLRMVINAAIAVHQDFVKYRTKKALEDTRRELRNGEIAEGFEGKMSR